MASEFTFEITKHIGVIKAYETGWSKEINIVSWHGGQPKVDIRDWDENHEKMSRGVTLTKEEFRKMVEQYGILGRNEVEHTRKVLSAAAMTYVAAAAASILQLLRLVLLFGRRRDD